MSRTGARPPGAGGGEVHRITGARPGRTEDLDRRMSRYLISMGIRTLCVILVLVIPGPVRWVFAAGAVFLPYVAVVLANSGAQRGRGPQAPPPEHRALGPGPSAGRDGGTDPQ